MIKYSGEKHLAISEVLIKEYQPVIGPLAVMVWIDLLYFAKREFTEWEEPILALTGLSKEELINQFELLEEADLIGLGDDSDPVKIYLNEPKPSKKETEAAATAISTDQTKVDQSLADDKKKIEAVYDYYHEKIGLMGARDYPLLNEWMEVRGMSPELIARAIEVTAENAQFPSMKYLDGVLKNWYNANIKTLKELDQLKVKTPNKNEKTSRFTSLRGQSTTPQKSMYKDVDMEKVRKWKELFKDDYKD